MQNQASLKIFVRPNIAWLKYGRRSIAESKELLSNLVHRVFLGSAAEALGGYPRLGGDDVIPAEAGMASAGG